MPVNFVDVLQDERAGRLDEVPGTERDLLVIRGYIHAERAAARDLGPRRTTPSIARSVLTKVWQEPRVGFHAQELRGHNLSAWGSKLLHVPWSEAAYLRAKTQNSIANLRLEHVTPIDALWKALREIDVRSEDDEEWLRDARRYLWVHFVVAVLTEEQAKAIDGAGQQRIGVPERPFVRYLQAIQVMQRRAAAGGPPAVPIDLARFVHPGLTAS